MLPLASLQNVYNELKWTSSGKHVSPTGSIDLSRLGVVNITISYRAGREWWMSEV